MKLAECRPGDRVLVPELALEARVEHVGLGSVRVRVYRPDAPEFKEYRTSYGVVKFRRPPEVTHWTPNLDVELVK